METETKDQARPVEQCPSCGRDLPETTPGPDGYWYVTDGDALGCGCAGHWSADGEGAWANHSDEDCLPCRDEEIEYLERERIARWLEHSGDACEDDRDRDYADSYLLFHKLADMVRAGAHHHPTYGKPPRDGLLAALRRLARVDDSTTMEVSADDARAILAALSKEPDE